MNVTSGIKDNATLQAALLSLTYPGFAQSGDPWARLTRPFRPNEANNMSILFQFSIKYWIGAKIA
jgi:hypothetical protein